MFCHIDYYLMMLYFSGHILFALMDCTRKTISLRTLNTIRNILNLMFINVFDQSFSMRWWFNQEQFSRLVPKVSTSYLSSISLSLLQVGAGVYLTFEKLWLFICSWSSSVCSYYFCPHKQFTFTLILSRNFLLDMKAFLQNHPCVFNLSDRWNCCRKISSRLQTTSLSSGNM